MNRKLGTIFLKSLVFLLPSALPVLLIVPSKWNPVTYEWNTTIAGIDANTIIYSIIVMYPVVSAIVFFKNKISVWSAPMVNLVLTAFSALFMSGSPNAFGMIFVVELAAIGWSLFCSLIAWTVRLLKRR
ncbi:MAG: hypothetical protein FWE98_04025 [Oscillospiraceae bacterium]|nr:hypothetical protein [Oscillospiraceae bacterium]